MAGRVAKFFAWLGVSAVLGLCFTLSCLTSAFFLSPEGRHVFRGAYRAADRLGDRGERTPRRRANASFNVVYDEGGGNPVFSGTGFTLPLPDGFFPREPAPAEAAKPRFDYYIPDAKRSVEIRCRRVEDLYGRDFSSGDLADRKALLDYARAYAADVGGKRGAATRWAYVAPGEAERRGMDVGVEGALAFTPEESRRQGYDGEYSAFWARGYGNVWHVSVAFKPFSAGRATATARPLTAALSCY